MAPPPVVEEDVMMTSSSPSSTHENGIESQGKKHNVVIDNDDDSATRVLFEIDMKKYIVANSSPHHWDTLIRELRQGGEGGDRSTIQQHRNSKIQISNLSAAIIPTDDDDDDDDGDSDKTNNNNKNPKLEELFSAIVEAMNKNNKGIVELCLLDLNASVLNASDQLWKLLEHPSIQNLQLSITINDCTNMRLIHKVLRIPNLIKFHLQLQALFQDDDDDSNNKIEAPIYLLTNSKSLEEITIEVVVIEDNPNNNNYYYLSERKWIGLCQCLHNTRETSKLRILDMKTIHIPNTQTSIQNLNELVEWNDQLDILHVLVPEEQQEQQEEIEKTKPTITKKKKKKDQVKHNTGKSNVETITWMAE